MIAMEKGIRDSDSDTKKESIISYHQLEEQFKFRKALN